MSYKYLLTWSAHDMVTKHFRCHYILFDSKQEAIDKGVYLSSECASGDTFYRPESMHLLKVDVVDFDFSH